MIYQQIINRVNITINKYELISKKDKVLLGVSGGPDSVAMLYILNKLGKELGFSLHVAHLDHMLRKDSYLDSVFVQNLAQKLKIPVSIGQTNVKSLAHKGSVEEIARNSRLNFFGKVAKEVGANKVALAHTIDDQAETVLMRLIRGAGLSGLSAILPKRKIQGLYVIRPLIAVRRKEIEAMLKIKKIKYRLDKTNVQEIYLRNKIRRRLLPLLELEYNRNIKEVLSNTAEIIGNDYEYLLQQASRLAKSFHGRIDLVKFNRLHISVQRMLLRQTIVLFSGDTRRLTFKHIEEIMDLIRQRPIGSVVDLPKGISVVKTKKTLNFRCCKKSRTSLT